MTRATLEFELPEDQDDFTMATKGHHYWGCLWDLSQELRRLRKHGELTDDQYELVEDIIKFFYDIVGDLLEEVS